MAYTQLSIDDRHRIADYMPKAPRSGKSQQLWIARHRRLHGN